MTKTFTQKRKAAKLWLLTSFLALFVNYSFAQDYDFQQGDDVNRLVVMEAEHYSTYTQVGDLAIWQAITEPDLSNDTAMQAGVESPSFADTAAARTNSSVLSYSINFTEVGTHFIWARASRIDGGSDSYHVGLDGKIQPSSMFLTFHQTSFENKTFGWINFQNSVEPATIIVPSAGVHTLDIFIREKKFKIDKIVLTISDSLYYKPDNDGPLGPDETPVVSKVSSKSLDNDIFSIYPNPIEDQLNVQLKNINFSDGILKIVNLQGKLVETEILDGDLTKSIDVSSIEPGMYLIQLEHNNKIVGVGKFLKL